MYIKVVLPINFLMLVSLYFDTFALCAHSPTYCASMFDCWPLHVSCYAMRHSSHTVRDLFYSHITHIYCSARELWLCIFAPVLSGDSDGDNPQTYSSVRVLSCFSPTAVKSQSRSIVALVPQLLMRPASFCHHVSHGGSSSFSVHR